MAILGVEHGLVRGLREFAKHGLQLIVLLAGTLKNQLSV
jgi:hypothetical protein